MTISGGEVHGDIHGGYSSGGDADSNSVTIVESTITSGNSAGHSIGGVYGGSSSSGNATGNTIIISKSTVKSDYSNDIHGGYSYSGNATGNTIIITESTVENSEIDGGYSYSGEVSNNSITLNNSNIAGSSIVSLGGGINGGLSYSGEVSNNTITINGGTVGGDICGGRSRRGNVTGNAINILGNPDLSSANLYGGYNYSGYTDSGTSSDNTLNLYSKNVTAQNIGYFQNLNFYIPNDASNGDTMLTLTDSAGTDLSGVAIRAGVVAGNSNLAVGDSINLLTNSNGLTTNSATSYGTLTEGVSLDYGLTLSNSGNSIVAQIESATVRNETESLPLSTGVTGIAIVDNVMDAQTMPTELTSTIDFEPETATEDSGGNTSAATDIPIVEPRGYEIFANMGGGSLRTKAGNGSYVDMTSQSINLGFARSFEAASGRFTIAPIIDYARGSYDSYLSNGTHGSGNTRYIAGGLIARRMLQNGFYYETSFRAGRVKTDFSSSDLSSTPVSYDTSATALAGHLKLGKAFRLNKNNLLDVYSVYYYARQGGMNADLSTGETYNFSSANSGRFKIGYRLTTRTSKISRIYTGLAYQYEHSSGVTATYKGYETPSAGNSGSSGMLEIGWIIKPLKVSPWAVDINTTGWVGHQRGITAMAKIQKAF